MTDDYRGQQFGNYRLLHPLGRGSFAEVYLAEHLYLEILAAIKILHMRMGPAAHESFLNEARTIGSLQHPHIIRVLDFGFRDQIPYLVMEYVANGTLRSRHPKRTTIAFEQIISYVKQIAAALDYAHGQLMPIVHCDVKPENILLNAQGEAVLSDFGIAIVRRTMSTLSTHKMAGTPLYMAPEQIEGHPCPASDQYALGVMVYEWLCGEPPFHGGNIIEVCRQHMHEPPPGLCKRLPQLPPAVEDAVFGALSKDPRQRFASVSDFAAVLEEACFATQPLLSSTSMSQFLTAPLPVLTHVAAQPLVARSLHEQQPITTSDAIATAPTKLLPVYTHRQRLLSKVYAIWISGVLEHSLHGDALLSLGFQEQPGAVTNPWRLVLQQSDMRLRSLPTGTTVTQVYDAAGGELLIMGTPGSGKTTLLLQLARDLLKRAEVDEHHPVPVVFNLSSWAAKQQRLPQWFVEELTSKYQVPRKLGKSLVAAEQILPLLDGLDEMPLRERSACIEAINSYRQDHGLQPLVICCRSADYLAQKERVQLGSAVVIQPLTVQQIDEYLARGGKPLWALRSVLQQDVELRGLARTPLMLSVMALTYQGQPPGMDVRRGSASSRQQQIFATYVQRMLERRGVETHYTKEQTISWLTYLACQMQLHNQTVFYLERMQPSWLADEPDRRSHARMVHGLIFGLIGLGCPGPLSGLALAQLWQAQNPLWLILLCSLLSCLLFGSFNALIPTPPLVKRPDGRPRRSWRRVACRIVRGILNGSLIGLLAGFPYGLSLWQTMGSGRLANALLTAGLFAFLGLGAFLLADVLVHLEPAEIRPAETFAWSWRGMGYGFFKFLGLSLLGALLIGLVGAVLYAGVYGMINGVGYFPAMLRSVLLIEGWFLWAYGPFFALIGSLFGAMTGAASGNFIDVRNITTPNQGIRRSVRHSVLVGSVCMVIGGIAGGLFGEVVTHVHDTTHLLIFALVFGPLIGIVCGLRVGGVACIQHFILCWLLRDADALPLRSARFLDFAAERVLLRKVGGGYSFVHRLLLDYFASLDR